VAEAKKQRIDWLDALKGIGILMVVLVHQKPGPVLTAYLQLLAAPIFFFAAGYLYDPDRFSSQKTFFRYRKQRIVKPYFYFSVISLVFWVVFGGGWLMFNKGALMEQLPVQINIGAGGMFMLFLLALPFLLFYGAAITMPHNIPLWFLTCLFVLENMFFFVQRKVKTDRMLFWVLLLLSLVGFIIGKLLPIVLPWNADGALSLLIYYGAGFMFRNKWGAGWQWSTGKKIGMAILFLVISLIGTVLNPSVHMVNNDMHRFLLYHMGASAGVGFFILLSQALAHLRPLIYLGRNTLVILGVHVMGMGVFLIFARAVLHIPVKDTMGSTPYALLYAAGTMVLTLPLIYVIKRYFPQIIGRPKPKNRQVGVTDGKQAS